MDRNSLKSGGIPAFGVSMLFGGLALILSVAILGFGTSSALANGVQGPLAQGTQPIPNLTSTPTAVATSIPTDTPVATTTAAATTTVGTGTATVAATGTVEATATAVVTPVGTVVGETATATVGTIATATTGVIPTTEVLPTEDVGMVETSTPIVVGMPSTGGPAGGSDWTVLLLLAGVMMTVIGFTSLASRRNGYRR
jgi:hypothetical protein